LVCIRHILVRSSLCRIIGSFSIRKVSGFCDAVLVYGLVLFSNGVEMLRIGRLWGAIFLMMSVNNVRRTIRSGRIRKILCVVWLVF
jgi:hypothetical protein